MPIRVNPAEQVAGLLGRLVFQVHHAANAHHADSIHDLRVSIRRFAQALRVFQDSFPRGERKGIRKELRAVMDRAAEVRNRDITLEFLAKAGLKPPSPLAVEIRAERDAAHGELLELLRRWEHRSFSSRWRDRLNLTAPRESAAAPAIPAKVAKRFFATGRKVMNGKRSPNSLHRLRLRTKRLRYTLELFVPAHGPALEHRIEALRGLQQRLGDISDCGTIHRVLDGRRDVPPEVERKLAFRLRWAVGRVHRYWEETFAPPEESARWMRYLAGMKPSRGAAADDSGKGEKAAATKTTKATRNRTAG